MNVKLLRKVKKHILEEPKRLVMSSYVRRKEGTEKIYCGNDKFRPYPRCGTAACIAGWALLLDGTDPHSVFSPHECAAKLLGLRDKQAFRLFEPREWPNEFIEGLTDDGKVSTARVAAARIDHFIKTKGAE